MSKFITKWFVCYNNGEADHWDTDQGAPSFKWYDGDEVDQYIAELEAEVERLTHEVQHTDKCLKEFNRNRIKEVAELKAELALKDKTIEKLGYRIAELNCCLHMPPSDRERYVQSEIDKAKEID